ncbi:lipase family protein [Frankia sp. ACN1ag]|uniref:lipase family protein n=1 Tax=Frankia sp. ACN1ag TaxID=102891 RepID=UPI00128EA625|nr:lipase family protein [Frankia sp. ACN1ag]
MSNAQVLDLVDLRPYRPRLDEHFPVYRDLVDHLAAFDDTHLHPDDPTSHVLAACAGYAYAETASTLLDPDLPRGINAVSAAMTRLGLPGCRCRIIAEQVDAMLIRSTAFVVQSADARVVIVAYRGTEPSDLINWGTDLDVHSRERTRVRLAGTAVDDLHAGFHRNVRATAFEVLRTLRRAMAGRSIYDTDTDGDGDGDASLRAGAAGTTRAGGAGRRRGASARPPALYLTGHSLGGAMAVILGLRIMADPVYAELRRALRAVYTFGQPMIGGDGTAAAYTAVVDPAPIARFVYRQDPVPHLPPATVGRYRHIGREWRYGGGWTDTTGRPVGQMLSTLGFAGALAAFPLGQVRPLGRLFPYTISDHFPHYYIDALAAAGVCEFGDDELSAGPDGRRRPPR